MKMIYPLIAYLLLLCFFSVKAQDIHFSQIHASGAILNPALTGVFEGKYRLTGNYRAQWKSVTANYRTSMFTMDSNVFEIGEHQHIGFGANFYADVAGDLNYTNNFGGVSLSGIRSFDKEGSHILSIGFEFGRISNHFDPNRIVSYDSDPLAFAIGNNQLKAWDISTGLLWYKKIVNQQFLYFGAAMYHINEPSYNFFGEASTNQKLYRRYVLHGGANIKLSRHWILIPNFIFMKQGPFQQYTAGSYWRYDTRLSNNRVPAAFTAGGWLRALYLEDRPAVDAVIATFRMTYGQYIFTVSYDINVSSLSRASFGRGGPELSLIYIFGDQGITSGGGPPNGRRNRRNPIKCPHF